MVSLFYKSWWKYLTMAIIFFVIVAGFTVTVPDLFLLHESIRNTFFHIPMWFGMVLLLLGSLVYSIRYLLRGRGQDDLAAASFAHAGLLMGFLGLATGTIWGVYTWADGNWSNTGWITDPKILGASLGILIYLAYFVLRGSMTNTDQRARVSAIYSIFGYAMFIVFIFVMPRLTDSLHPGNGGNPGFGEYDLTPTMRMVFYPAVIGWAMLGMWLASLRFRTMRVQEETHE